MSLASRVLGMIVRGLLTAVDDTTREQLISATLLAGEPRERVRHAQPYGFTAVPLDGAVPTLVALGGSREQLIAICVSDPRYRPTGLEAGEVALYTDEGDRVALLRNGVIVLRAAEEVRLGSDSASDPVVRKSDLDALVATFNAHDHTIPAGTDSAGGTTGAGPSHTATASEKVFAE